MPGHGVTTRDISTHALREEGDGDLVDDYIRRLDISTHALREEGDFVIFVHIVKGI